MLRPDLFIYLFIYLFVCLRESRACHVVYCLRRTSNLDCKLGWRIFFQVIVSRVTCNCFKCSLCKSFYALTLLESVDLNVRCGLYGLVFTVALWFFQYLINFTTWKLVTRLVYAYTLLVHKLGCNWQSEISRSPMELPQCKQ